MSSWISWDTYRIRRVFVTDALAIKDEAHAVLGLAHTLGVRALQLRELGSPLDLEEYLVAVGVLHLDVQLLSRFGLGDRLLVRHVGVRR